MSVQNTGINRTFKSAADLEGKQYRICKVTAQNTVNLASAATDVLAGVINNAPIAGTGSNVDVRMRGQGASHKVILGGTVTIGAKLTADANGAAVATTTSGDQVVGIALMAGVSGDIIEYRPADQIVD